MQHLLHLPVRDRLEYRLTSIKEGDDKERESLIEEYIPFIIKSVSNTTKRYVESENSDEYIIGLEGFNEAIDKYDPVKGKFISFASMVIKSRVTDFLRKQGKYRAELMSCMSEEILYSISETDDNISDVTDNIALRGEMEEFALKLKAFNITFHDLVRESPKHRDTRQNALRVAYHIYSKAELKQELMLKKGLPITKLINELNISKKLIYRSRIFVIAVVLILDSNMDCLKCYIAEAGGGEWDGI